MLWLAFWANSVTLTINQHKKLSATRIRRGAHVYLIVSCNPPHSCQTDLLARVHLFSGFLVNRGLCRPHATRVGTGYPRIHVPGWRVQLGCQVIITMPYTRA
jgi:hypothetical protein